MNTATDCLMLCWQPRFGPELGARRSVKTTDAALVKTRPQEYKEDTMRTLHKLVLFTSAAIAITAFPATAEQGQQPGSGDHGLHHVGGEPQKDRRVPISGVKGQGEATMENGGQEMMGHCAMGEDGQAQDMMNCPMMGEKETGMMHSSPMMEARLAYMKNGLAITEVQTAAWEAYADAVRARHTEMEGSHAALKKASEDASGFDCLDARIKATKTNLESLMALKPATEALYSTLTDEQRDKADTLIGSSCGMM